MQKHVQENEMKHIFSDKDLQRFADFFSLLIKIDQRINSKIERPMPNEKQDHQN